MSMKLIDVQNCVEFISFGIGLIYVIIISGVIIIMGAFFFFFLKREISLIHNNTTLHLNT